VINRVNKQMHIATQRAVSLESRCMSAFLGVLSCLGKGLAMGRYPVQGVLPNM